MSVSIVKRVSKTGDWYRGGQSGTTEARPSTSSAHTASDPPTSLTRSSRPSSNLSSSL